MKCRKQWSQASQLPDKEARNYRLTEPGNKHPSDIIYPTNCFLELVWGQEFHTRVQNLDNNTALSFRKITRLLIKPNVTNIY